MNVMTTRLMGRLMLLIGVLALVLLVACSLAAPVGDEATLEGLQSHLLVGLLAVLMLAFSQGWIVLFLLGSGVALSRSLADPGSGLPALSETSAAMARRQSRSARLLVLPWSILAALLVVLVFVVGSRAYSGEISSEWHLNLAVAAIAVQALSIVLAWFGLERNQRALELLVGKRLPKVGSVEG